MGQLKLTDAKIKALRPSDNRYIVWDERDGLGVRVSVNGKKSFIVAYRFEGRSRMMTLDDPYPKLKLKAARTKASKAMEDLDKGVDPGAEKSKEKASRKDTYTVADLVDEFIEEHSKAGKRSWKEDKRCLNSDVVPYIGKMPVNQVRRRDLIEIIDRIKNRGSKGQAIRTKKVIAKMFKVGMERDVIETSPADGLPSLADLKPKPRKRYLKDSEIRELWTKLPDSDIPLVIQLIVKFLLVTGQRRGEATGAPWSEFDLEEKVWIIPEGRTKNKMLHRVPLSRLAIKLLHEIKSLNQDSGYLFPSNSGKRYLDPGLVSKSLKKAQGHWEFEETFRPHDLRRTLVTGMAALGILQLTISKVVNHSEGGITKDYNQHEYDPEKRKALEQWGQKLEAIITGEKAKVITLHK
jgi:integrase